MHLPDGFLDVKTAVISAAVSTVGLAVALRQVRTSLEPRQMPLLGLGAAFVFAAQMLNFPVVGGTSGHLLGGVLMAILLGPSAAILVMTCVLIVQCLMFADGGLLALGANVFNLALVSVCGGYLVFRVLKMILRMEEQRSTVFAAAFAGWFGTVLASITCAGQLSLSKTVPWAVAFPAMAGIHMLIGIGEGLATALIVLAVLKTRPDLAFGAASAPGSQWIGFVAYGTLVSLGLAVFVAPFACAWPDGLERVAANLGFAGQATEPSLPAPVPDYQFPLLGTGVPATAAAGVIGTVVALLAAYGLARLLVPVLNPRNEDAAPRK